MTDEELIKQAINCGQFYGEKKFKSAPLPDKLIAVNACAHGFFAGVKWLSEHLLKEKDHGTSEGPAGKTGA